MFSAETKKIFPLFASTSARMVLLKDKEIKFMKQNKELKRIHNIFQQVLQHKDLPEHLNLDKFFLFCEFINYHNCSYEDKEEIFFSDLIKLYKNLKEEEIFLFFNKYGRKADDVQDNGIKSLFCPEDFNTIKETLEKSFKKTSSRKEEENFYLSAILAISKGELSYRLTTIVNNLLKNNRENLISETTLIEKFGQELILMLSEKLFPPDKADTYKEIILRSLFMIKRNDENSIKQFNEFINKFLVKNKSNNNNNTNNQNKDFGFDCIISLLITSLSLYETKEIKIFWQLQNETKSFIYKLGAILVSYLRTKKIQSEPLIEIIKKPWKTGFLNFVRFNENFLQSLIFRNLPIFSFKNVINKRVELKIPGYGTKQRIFKSIPEANYKMEIVKFPQNLQDNLDYLNGLAYFLDSEYLASLSSFFQEITTASLKQNLHNLEILFDINFRKIRKKNILNMDDCAFLLNEAKNFSIKPVFQKLPKFGQIFKSAYIKKRDLFLNKLNGQKILLRNILEEAFFLNTVLSSKKLKNEMSYFYFQSFVDSRNRVYLGNNNLSPMANSRYSRLLLSYQKPLIEYYDQVIYIYEGIKKDNNCFVKILNEELNQENFLLNPDTFRKSIYQEFEKENSRNLFFIKKYQLTTKNLSISDYFKIFKKEKLKINKKEIFLEYSNYLECLRYLKEKEDEDFTFKHFYEKDTSSSGIQLSALLIGSPALLKFSNFIGNQKSGGYQETYNKFIEKVINPLCVYIINNKKEFTNYFNQNFWKFYKKTIKEYPLIKNIFDSRTFAIFGFCIKKNKKSFLSIFNESLIKELAIGALYGMSRKGFKRIITDQLIKNGLVDFYQKLTIKFIKKERKSIKEFKIKKQIRNNPKNPRLKSVIDWLNLKKDLRLLKAEPEKNLIKIDILQKSFKLIFKNSLIKLGNCLIKNSEIKDVFTKIQKVFKNIVKIKILLKDNQSLLVKNDDFSFKIKYNQRETKVIRVKSLEFQDQNKFILKSNRKITITKVLENQIDFNKLRLGISASFIQSQDALILNKFLEICRYYEIPVNVKHDQFKVPFAFHFLLRPLLAEIILKIKWSDKLFNFCQINRIFKKVLCYETPVEFCSILLNQFHIKTIILPNLYCSELFKINKNIFSKIKDCPVLLADFLVNLEILLEFLDSFHLEFYDYFPDNREEELRKSFTNEFFIK